MGRDTFGYRALSFYSELEPDFNLPENVFPINVYKEKQVHGLLASFFEKFFSDCNKRILVLGINPGRFGSGVTGIPFTDPLELDESCGISNDFPKRRELSSQFVYHFIKHWGEVEGFYRNFFVSAVSPLGFTRDGTNCNYYDDEELFNSVRPFIISSLEAHASFGTSDVVILLGSGKNKEFFTKINEEIGLFNHVFSVEHPRFVMQYRRRHLQKYLNKYHKVFKRAIELA